MNISYSRMSSYLACPYGHYLRYVEHLNLKKPVKPLYFGTDFHKLLELRNKPKLLEKARKDIEDKFYEMPPQFQSELGENYVENLFTIFDDYSQVYKGCEKPIETERPFSIHLGNYKGEPVNFVGVIDEIYESETGLYLGEHKTFSYKPSMNTLVMNTQKCLYSKALEKEYGSKAESCLWDYIKSEPSASPIWLEKSQRFSEAKSEKITPYSWKRACAEKGITDPKIIALGDNYSGNIQNYFFRLKLDMDDRMVEGIWDSFRYTAKEIVKNSSKNKTKNVTRNCEYCSYRDICYAEFTEGDATYIKNRDYEVK